MDCFLQSWTISTASSVVCLLSSGTLAMVCSLWVTAVHTVSSSDYWHLLKSLNLLYTTSSHSHTTAALYLLVFYSWTLTHCWLAWNWTELSVPVYGQAASIYKTYHSSRSYHVPHSFHQIQDCLIKFRRASWNCLNITWGESIACTWSDRAWPEVWEGGSPVVDDTTKTLSS